jgi:hypothetical protein
LTKKLAEGRNLLNISGVRRCNEHPESFEGHDAPGNDEAKHATAVRSHSRQDAADKLEALRISKFPPKSSDSPPPPPSFQPLERLKNEIKALQSDCDEDERWIITPADAVKSLSLRLQLLRTP